jgi:tetratricopeptide (TPR) repeat protein
MARRYLKLCAIAYNKKELNNNIEFDNKMKKQIIFTVVWIVFCTSLFAQKQYNRIVQTDIILGYSESSAMNKLSNERYELSEKDNEDGLKVLVYEKTKSYSETLRVAIYTKNGKVVRMSFSNTESSYSALEAQLEEENGFKSFHIDWSDKYYSASVKGTDMYMKITSKGGGLFSFTSSYAQITFMMENDSEILKIKREAAQKRQEEQERMARERQEEQLRLEQEARMVREENYQKLVQNAESALNQQQYPAAKDFYRQAIMIKPESMDSINGKIAEIDAGIEIRAFCDEADRLFSSKQYEKAKEKYAGALRITPNTKTGYIKEKISDIDALLLFLKERTYKQYDYKDLEAEDYDAKEDYIKNELQKNLLAGGESLPETTVSIVCEVDTFGISTFKYSTSGQNSNLNVILEKLSKSTKLTPCFINDYSVNAKTGFEYVLEYNHAIVTVKKNADDIRSGHKDFNIYRSNIDSELSSAPCDKYTFDMNKTIINGQEYNSNKLIKMSGTGGASNALLSLLVPGLDDHCVSYGKKSGVGTALWTYGLIGAGVGLKIYSNKGIR